MKLYTHTHTHAISVEHKEYKLCTQNTSCYWN